MSGNKRRICRPAALLLAICILAAALPSGAFAADTLIHQVGDRAFLSLNRFTGALTSAVNLQGSVSIPSEIEGVRVTSIADGALSDQSNLTEIRIPSSVETIGDRAFAACVSLRSVRIEEGLSSLGKNAFQYCYALTDVSLPSTLTSIDSYAFASCLALRSITLPSGVFQLGSYVFSDCKNLSSVTMPDGIATIGDYTFSGCRALTSVTLPKGLTAIPTALFSDCASLSQVTVPGSVKSVGSSAFGRCTALTRLALPEGVNRIYDWAFTGCSNLKEISMPNSVNSIAADSFYGCEGVTFYVNAGSYSQVFASANKIPFVVGSFSGGGDNQPGNYPATPFVDEPSHWASKYIRWSYAKGYFSGTSETTFSPDTAVTRGMLVALIHRMEGRPSGGSSPFADVSDSSYYAEAVAWAKTSGIVSGVSETEFAPSRNITREQLASILYRYAEYKKKNTSAQGDLSRYKDNNRVSGYAGTAMAWAVGAGIISGTDSSTLNPRGNATRAQSAVMLYEFENLK